MKHRFSPAFTLIEIVTAMTVILILSGLVMAIASFVNSKTSRTRAADERRMLEMCLNSYKAECGRFPQDAATDALEPKTHFMAGEAVYKQASLYVYKELTGDRHGATSGSEPDGVLDDGARPYWEPREPRMLKVEKDANQRTTRVLYIQDPWGEPYGYSTAALAAEQDYQQTLGAAGGAAERPSGAALRGFNLFAPDLWSTANTRPAAQPTSSSEQEKLWARWIKNW